MRWLVPSMMFGLVLGCGRDPAAVKPEAPAKNTQSPKENQLNTLILTVDAEQRLGLRTAPVERRSMPRTRSYGGEVVLPASALFAVAAPVSGRLQYVKGKKLAQVGEVVREGQAILELVPRALSQAEHVSLGQAKLLIAQARVDADGQVKQAKVQMEAANIVVKRAQRLYQEKAGTRKELDDAEAQMQLALKALATAEQRRKIVEALELDTEPGSIKPLIIRSPARGIVKATFATDGTLVPAGAALFEIMNMDIVWIKVPVYVGDLTDIAEDKAALVTELAGPARTTGESARPVPSPPTALAQASAVDLYYQLPNPTGKYRPGQRVGVQITLKGEENSLRLPWSAVVHDINGGAWVYVQTQPRHYVRQRVQVRYLVDDWAVLADGPRPGAQVVTEGAAELFGSEFGFGS